MLSQPQAQLQITAQRVIQRLVEAGQHLPFFGLFLDSLEQFQELLPSHIQGEEEASFNSLVEDLQSAVAAGASGTAIVILLEPATVNDNMSGATIDLDQLGGQRFLGFMPFSVIESRVVFHDAKFTNKPSLLFHAP